MIGALQADLAYRFYWLIFRLELLMNMTTCALIIIFSEEIAAYFAQDDEKLYEILESSMLFASVLIVS